jgi:D-alanyl-D-alanine carboxypeptidase
VLTLRLAGEGLFDLDDPLSDWLPEYHNVDGTITIRQLLNHTSGVFNVFEHPEFPWVGPDVDYAKAWPITEVFESFVDAPYGPPGQVQHYSSTNYLLLTAILQRAGVNIPERIQTDLLMPLNLEHSYISMGEPLPAQFVAAHPWVDVNEDGTLDDLFGAPVIWKVSLTHPVIFTTAGDLARWMQALYHDKSVLDSAALDAMLTFPETPLRDPDGASYGLGVVDYSDILGMEVIGHGGSALGFSAAALYLPDYRTSLVWLINTGESPADLASALMGETWLALSDVLREHLEPHP